MTRKPVDGLVASIRQRLLNTAARTGDDANQVWSRYAVERLLYRLSISEFSREFVLKGASLFAVWTGEPYRPTLDLDLLAYGEDSEERIVAIFRQLCAVEVEVDGIRFDAQNIRIETIRENAEYKGRRVHLVAFLGKAIIPVQVDIGFGDVVTPAPVVVNFPTLLDLPAPRIQACPRPTVVAEKLHAMVVLGMANSRMKDFYDLYTLAERFPFDGQLLVNAVKATFKRRNTDIPLEPPIALTDEFSRDRTKQAQWKAFVRKIAASQESDLVIVLERLKNFLLPVLHAAAGGIVPGRWEPVEGWRE